MASVQTRTRHMASVQTRTRHMPPVQIRTRLSTNPDATHPRPVCGCAQGRARLPHEQDATHGLITKPDATHVPSKNSDATHGPSTSPDATHPRPVCGCAQARARLTQGVLGSGFRVQVPLYTGWYARTRGGSTGLEN